MNYSSRAEDTSRYGVFFIARIFCSSISNINSICRIIFFFNFQKRKKNPLENGTLIEHFIGQLYVHFFLLVMHCVIIWRPLF